MVKRHVHGSIEMAQTSVHVLPPAGARWIVTVATPESASAGVVVSVTVPLSGVPGSLSEIVGSVLSTWIVCSALVVALPAMSVATARRS